MTHRLSAIGVYTPKGAALATFGLCWSFCVVVILASSAAWGAAPSSVTVDAARPLASVPAGLYGVGYNGWGDITDPEAIRALQDVQIRWCRLDVDLKLICGNRLGDWRWEYTTDRDRGQGFIARVRQIGANGWTPMLALSTSHSLPAWFKGDPTDAKGTPWTKLNLDGSPAAAGESDQYAQLEQITQALAAGLAERGLKGLHWETIYEIGHTMPMVEIHHRAARGIRQADPTAKLMGPATWPGWTVEERFVKPYLATYGPDLLDVVSVHWYADNEHGLWAAPGWKERQGPVTMGDRVYLQYLMETVPKYAEWCRSLRARLDDPQINPSGKRIGIAYSEFDVVAESPYQRNPENPDWPRYRAAADCYLNTNVFGGVWCAAVLCDLAASGACDVACKFNARQFYGLIDNKPGGGGGYFRQPVWFAWKLLQDVAQLRAGATLLACAVSGPTDRAAAHVGGKDTPWVRAYAVRTAAGPRLILINRSLEPQDVDVRIAGLGSPPGAVPVQRYRYDEGRVGRFIGRQPGTTPEGQFEGGADDTANLRCLEILDTLAARVAGGTLSLGDLQCPPISITVLVPARLPPGGPP